MKSEEMIRYESSHPAEETRTADAPPVNSEYLWEMCDEKFGGPSRLRENGGSAQGPNWAFES